MDQYLSKFSYSDENESDLVIIPSSLPLSLPPDADEDMRNQEKEILGKLAQENHLNLSIPENGNIYRPDFADTFTHTPQQRAAMIYEAINARNEDGSFKHHNIYLTGGHNAEDVILELERLCKIKGQLPQRAETLKTFGFSDATQLHQYLGQRGISTPVAYSKNIKTLINELSKISESRFQLRPLNQKAKSNQEIKGMTMPAAFRQTANRPTHQAKLFSDKINIVFNELRGGSKKEKQQAAVDFYNSLQHPGLKNKPLCIMFSKDTPAEAADKFLELAGEQYPVYTGAPCGHGDSLRDGSAFSFFSNCTIDRNGMATVAASASSQQSSSLLQQSFISPAPLPGGNKISVENAELRGGTAYIPDLEHLRNSPPQLTFNFDLQSPMNSQEICQVVDMSLKELRERGVIQADTFRSLQINGPEYADLSIMREWLNDQQQRYLPHTSLRYNDNEITPAPPQKTAMLNRVAALRNQISNRQHSPQSENTVSNKTADKLKELRNPPVSKKESLSQKPINKIFPHKSNERD